MSLISELMKCAKCEHLYGDLLERSQRDEAYECPSCGEWEARRTQAIPHVSTAKTSASTPDVLPKRFDKLRRQQELKKEKSKARTSKDLVSEDKINKELKTLNK